MHQFIWMTQIPGQVGAQSLLLLKIQEAEFRPTVMAYTFRISSALPISLKYFAGVRWSYVENKITQTKNFVTNSDPRPKGTATNDNAFSPKFGLVYTPNENLSVFATYTNSFAANTGYDINRDALKPTTIDQYEVGIKKNLWNNAIAVNFSAYQILYKNYYQTAELDPSGKPNSDTNMKEFAGKCAAVV
jgi:iron complex outermembrane receptor protein